MVTTRSQGQASPEDSLPLRSRRSTVNNNTPVRRGHRVADAPPAISFESSILPDGVVPKSSPDNEDTITIDLRITPTPGNRDTTLDGGLETRGHKRFASEYPDPDEFHTALEDHTLSTGDSPKTTDGAQSTIRNRNLEESGGDDDGKPEESTTRATQQQENTIRTPRGSRSRKKQKVVPDQFTQTIDVPSSTSSLADTDRTITANSDTMIDLPPEETSFHTETDSTILALPTSDNHEPPAESPFLSNDNPPTSQLSPSDISSPLTTTIPDMTITTTIKSYKPIFNPPPTLLKSGLSNVQRTKPITIPQSQFTLPAKSTSSLSSYRKEILSRHPTKPAWTAGKVRFV